MQLWKLSTIPKSCREVLTSTFILHTIVIDAGTNYNVCTCNVLNVHFNVNVLINCLY